MGTDGRPGAAVQEITEGVSACTLCLQKLISSLHFLFSLRYFKGDSAAEPLMQTGRS